MTDMQSHLASRCVLALAFLATGRLLAQAPAAPQFEVASIKPAPPLDRESIMSGKMRVGLHIDAARVDIGSLSLSDLLTYAFRVKNYQLKGPDWMSGQRWDVHAKMPEGAMREQVPEMMQALLAERFGLTFHRDSSPHSVYVLVVGKDGPKMKEADPSTDPPAPAGAAPSGPGGRAMLLGSGERVAHTPGGRGFAVAGGRGGPMKVQMGEGGAMRMEFGKMSMSALADTLARFADRPVVDMTELKGNYQVALDLSMEEMRNAARASGMGAGMMMHAPPGAGAPADTASTPSGASIFTAVQKLGLKLEPRKAPLEIIVIDKLEKTPSEN